MAEYTCSTCGRSSKLPDYCCDESMVQRGKYYCNTCRAQSSTAKDCCGTPMKLM